MLSSKKPGPPASSTVCPQLTSACLVLNTSLRLLTFCCAVYKNSPRWTSDLAAPHLCLAPRPLWAVLQAPLALIVLTGPIARLSRSDWIVREVSSAMPLKDAVDPHVGGATRIGT